MSHISFLTFLSLSFSPKIAQDVEDKWPFEVHGHDGEGLERRAEGRVIKLLKYFFYSLLLLLFFNFSFFFFFLFFF